MKKKFITSLILILVIMFFPLILTGCNEPVYSLDDFDSLYADIKKDDYTSQFFMDDNLKVTFSSNIQTNNREDKSYIFGAVYDHYLKSSSRLFSCVIKNQPKPSFILRNFKQEEVTNLYNKLQNVKNEMENFYRSKTVYEKTDGYVYYRNLLNSYNLLISSLYDFNTCFANAYFSSVGNAQFSSSTLSDRNIKDFLSYQLMQISKVSFYYELVPFKINNPLTEVHTYLDSANEINSFITLSNMTISRIDTQRDITPTGSNSINVTNLFTLIQENANKYDSECEKFIKAINNFDAKSYQSSNNKELYIKNCSALERSSFNIIQNFIQGRYLSQTRALTQAVSSLTY